MSAALTKTKCFHHLHREAIGRCNGCRKFYCRECLNEMDGQLTCAACINIETEQHNSRGVMVKFLNGGALVFGFFMLWILFYFFGRILLDLTDFFHTSLID